MTLAEAREALEELRAVEADYAHLFGPVNPEVTPRLARGIKALAWALDELEKEQE